ncbi:MAG: hypothetical protein WC850_05240 [Candidatus Gracilibacteria bacterium]
MTLLNFFLATDKQKHLIISILLLFMFFLIRKVLLKRKGYLIQLSFSLRDVFAIGILKEIVDLFGFGHPELLDLFADFFGILVIFYIYFLYREGKNLEENNKFFRYEIGLIQKLKEKFMILIKRLSLFLSINYKILIYKKRILYYLPSKTRKFLFKRSFFEFMHIIVYTFILSIIWFINLLILVLKIPFLAIYDAINGIVWMIKYSFDLDKNDLKNV